MNSIFTSFQITGAIVGAAMLLYPKPFINAERKMLERHKLPGALEETYKKISEDMGKPYVNITARIVGAAFLGVSLYLLLT